MRPTVGALTDRWYATDTRKPTRDEALRWRLVLTGALRPSSPFHEVSECRQETGKARMLRGSQARWRLSPEMAQAPVSKRRCASGLGWPGSENRNPALGNQAVGHQQEGISGVMAFSGCYQPLRRKPSCSGRTVLQSMFCKQAGHVLGAEALFPCLLLSVPENLFPLLFLDVADYRSAQKRTPGVSLPRRQFVQPVRHFRRQGKTDRLGRSCHEHQIVTRSSPASVPLKLLSR